MMKRSRVGRKPDMTRISAAVERPGIDPRINTALGYVEKFNVDEKHGVFADVRLQNGQLLPCRVSSIYGGQGWGFYAPLEVDDEVVVSLPLGDPDHGGVVIAKTWSASELQPKDANDNPADVILLAKKDTNVRIKVQGSGNVVIGADDGKVLLGDESGTSPVHRKGDHEDMGTWQVTMGVGPLATCIIAISWTPPGGGTPTVFNALTPGPFPLTSQAKDGSGKVESS